LGGCCGCKEGEEGVDVWGEHDCGDVVVGEGGEIWRTRGKKGWKFGILVLGWRCWDGFMKDGEGACGARCCSSWMSSVNSVAVQLC
jgi:hypothetical protein